MNCNNQNSYNSSIECNRYSSSIESNRASSHSNNRYSSSRLKSFSLRNSSNSSRNCLPRAVPSGLAAEIALSTRASKGLVKAAAALVKAWVMAVMAEMAVTVVMVETVVTTKE